MRGAPRRWLATVFGAVLVTSAVGAVARAAPTASPTASPAVTWSGSFPLHRFTDLVVDDVDGHVFISGREEDDYDPAKDYPANASETVVVRGLDGAPQKVLDGLPGASGLALDPSSHRLYVALRRADTIAAVDTRTLEVVARYPLLKGSTPRWLVVSNSIVWFSGRRGISSLDPADPTTQQTYYSGCLDTRLVKASAAPDMLASVDDYQYCAFQVEGTRIVRSNGHAHNDPEQEFARPFALMPDGTELLTYGSSYDTVSFKSNGAYGPGEGPLSRLADEIALDAEGNLAIGRDVPDGTGRNTEIRIVDRATLLAQFTLRSSLFALAFNADSSILYFLDIGDLPDRESARLGLVHMPIRPASKVTVSGPDTSPTATPLTLSGTVTAAGAPVTNAPLSVTRTDPRGTTTLTSVTSDAQGRYTVTDTPANAGRNVYCVRYDGGTNYRPSCGSATVRVQAVTRLTVVTPPRGQTRDLSVNGRLTSDGEPLAGAAVSVSLVVDGATEYTDTVNTSDDGSYTVGPVTPSNHDDPYAGTFTVDYHADESHQAASAVASDSARRPAETTVLQLTATPAGTTTALVGSVRSRSGGFAAPLSFIRRDGFGIHRLPDVRADAHGAFRLDDGGAAPGDNTYVVSYAGSGFLEPGSASAVTTRPMAAPALTITTDRSRYAAGTTAAIIARLGTTASNRRLAIYATPNGGPARLVRSGPVDTTGVLRTTTRITTSTVFTAVFAGDGAAAPRRVSTAVSSTAVLRSSLSSGRHRKRYTVFGRSARPRAVAYVLPTGPRVCVQMRTQRKVAGHWRAAGLTSCAKTDRLGRVVVSLRGTKYRAHSPYRLRFERRADARALAGTSSWRYLRFG